MSNNRKGEHVAWLDARIERSFADEPFLETPKVRTRVLAELLRAPKHIRAAFEVDGLSSQIRRRVKALIDPADGYPAYLHLKYQDEEGKTVDMYGLVKNFRALEDWERAKQEAVRDAYAVMRASNEIVRRARQRGFQLEFEFPWLEEDQAANQ